MCVMYSSSVAITFFFPDKDVSAPEKCTVVVWPLPNDDFFGWTNALASLEIVTQEECEKKSAMENRTVIANNVQNTVKASLIVTIYYNF